MALIKNISLIDNFGDEKQFANCYIKVHSLTGNKNQMRVSIAIYREKNGQNISNQEIIFSPDLSGSNFIEQAYNAMKNDQRFAGATDV